MGQEMPQRLVVGVRHDFGHPLQVLAFGLDQAAEILLRLAEHAPGARTGMWREAADGGNEAIGQMVERLRWRAEGSRAVVARRARFATPAGLLGCLERCDLIRNIASEYKELNVTK